MIKSLNKDDFNYHRLIQHGNNSLKIFIFSFISLIILPISVSQAITPTQNKQLVAYATDLPRAVIYVQPTVKLIILMVMCLLIMGCVVM